MYSVETQPLRSRKAPHHRGLDSGPGLSAQSPHLGLQRQPPLHLLPAGGTWAVLLAFLKPVMADRSYLLNTPLAL